MTAARDNSDKPRLSDLFHLGIAVDRLVSHMNKGREKYPDVDGVPNFRLAGKPDQEYLDCMMRHIRCIQQGEVIDSEGYRHDAAIAWNAMALSVCNYSDDKPTPADYAKASYEDNQARLARADKMVDDGLLTPQGTNRPDIIEIPDGDPIPMMANRRNHLTHHGQWYDCNCWYCSMDRADDERT